MSSQGDKRFKEKMVNGFRFERRNSNFLAELCKVPKFTSPSHLLQILCSTEPSHLFASISLLYWALHCMFLPSLSLRETVSLTSSPTKNSFYFLTHFKLSSFNVKTREKNPHKAQVGVQCKAHPRQAWVHKTHTFTGKQTWGLKLISPLILLQKRVWPLLFSFVHRSPPVAHFIPNLTWIGVLMPHLQALFR